MQIMQNAEHFVISTRVSLAETNLTENKRFSSAKLFQLTSPQGDEPLLMFGIIPNCGFQFTSPQGDERCIRTVISVCYDFNSRLRKETNKDLLQLF